MKQTKARHIKTEEVQINNDVYTHKTVSRKRHKKVFLTKSELLDLSHILRFLNNKDRDIFYLSCCAGMSQQMIQQLLNCYQSNVSYSLSIIKKRIKFSKFLYDNLYHIYAFINNCGDLLTTIEQRVLLIFCYCTSYKLTASVLDLDQGRIAIYLKKILKTMKTNKYKSAYNVLFVCMKNLNILKRTLLK